ncbi:polyamine aminopropyltransferase [Chloroflexota bacterium]
MQDIATNWFMEFVTPDVIQQFSISNIIYTGKTQFQSVQIVESPAFGKCLILDGKIQSSELDEPVYHEALVHPAMITHPHPRTVFIGGGGEGSTLREVLRHNTVEKVVMVDLDKEVVDLCKEYLPSMHQGAFEDSRLELLHTDALKYLAETKEKFDVMILDFTEPLEEGPAYLLFTSEFYKDIRRNLTPDATISLQAGASSMMILSTFLAVNNTLKTAFPIVAPYLTEIPSFCGTWGFAVASQKHDPRDLPPAEIDSRLSSRVSGDLRLYDGLSHQGMLSVPRYLREQLDSETRVITRDRPLFTY